MQTSLCNSCLAYAQQAPAFAQPADTLLAIAASLHRFLGSPITLQSSWFSCRQLAWPTVLTTRTKPRSTKP
jgi:hypothetical protein